MATRKRDKKGKKKQRWKKIAKSPVKTLPAKYQRYFDKHFGNGKDDKAHDMCCRSLVSVLAKQDPGIGDQLADLAEQAFQNDQPLTKEEDAALRGWPPEQLRVFREGLYAIFGDPEGCPDNAVRRGRFRGRPGHKRQSIEVGVELDRVEITFYGP